MWLQAKRYQEMPEIFSTSSQSRLQIRWPDQDQMESNYSYQNSPNILTCVSIPDDFD